MLILFFTTQPWRLRMHQKSLFDLATLTCRFVLLFAVLCCPHVLSARLPQIEPKQAQSKIDEMLHAHVSHKKIDKEIARRALQNYVEQLDPSKTYFLESDVQAWVEPTDEMLDRLLKEYQEADYKLFAEIQTAMNKAIARRRAWSAELDKQEYRKKVDIHSFKELKWTKTEDELKERVLKIRALQKQAVEKLEPDLQTTSVQRIAKRQARVEDEILEEDAVKRQRFLLMHVLKATASALDAHTSYFAPDEAEQFMISVQQRLFGIGAQLRDDINGFTITKLVEGGPAARSGLLKAKDKIIAVNGEPVVGMDVADAVELIRGEANTPVVLTILRVSDEAPGAEAFSPHEHRLDVTILRGEVVIQEARYERSIIPFGNGVIAYLQLHSFYQDPEHSSADDLKREIEKIEKEHKLLGVLVDLRGNTGGLLTQAVAVTGLFITKGIVVSIQDEEEVQHLRTLEGRAVWGGPLVILTDRSSASASEIVAQALQDYGRAIIVGDDRTYGKGSFQTFTLNTTKNGSVNPTGEYKVTRGRYYTVSGKTPQLIGVLANVLIPGPYSEMDVGEKFLKYPLENHTIPASYDDQLLDIPPMQRQAVRMLYQYNAEPKSERYFQWLDQLKSNSQLRIQENKRYKSFLEELKKKSPDSEEDVGDASTRSDFALDEAIHVLQDLILFDQADQRARKSASPAKEALLEKAPLGAIDDLRFKTRKTT